MFGSGGGLPREGVGAKKFGMSFETQGFWLDIPEVPEKFEKIRFVFNFRPLCEGASASSKPTTEFAQSRLSRSN